jgi:hypothetical protein
MPAQFTIRAADLTVLLAELKKVDPGLRRALQKEMRDDLKGFAKELAATAPPSSPLSGFAKGVAKTPRYTYTTPLSSVKTPLGQRSKKPGFFPVVSMGFRGRSKTAGFNIMELAGTANIGRKKQGLTPQGRAMIRNLNAKFPVIDGLGRFIIPESKKDSDEPVKVARRIIEKYVALVNRRIR